MNERRITAAHEIGHVLMAHTLGRPVTVASIRPTSTYDGIASHERLGFDGVEVEEYVCLPVVLWPDRVRAAVETDILIALAGPIAESLAGEPSSGYVTPHSDELAARELLEPSAAAYLDELEARTEPFETDDEAAVNLSRALAGESVTQHLSFMRAEARRIVFSHTFRRHHAMLMPRLLDRGALSGEQMLDIIEADSPVAAAVS